MFFNRIFLFFLELASIMKWLRRRYFRRFFAVARKILVSWIPFAPPRAKMNSAREESDYFFFGVIDWNFRFQRPQQLARSLADGGRRVFYISPDFRDDLRSGFDIKCLDDLGRLYLVNIYCDSPPVIYFKPPSDRQLRQLRAGLGELLRWSGSSEFVSLMQHPFWLDVARVIPNSKLVYDCIDYHDGFGNNSAGILALEKRTISEVDKLITTSAWLDAHVAGGRGDKLVLRNACDFHHFFKAPAVVFRSPRNRKIIGYIGAIASWLDIDLIRRIAESFPECCVLMVGADTVGAQRSLVNLDNIRFVGEAAYGNLPFYLHGFDVAILPFKVLPLTLATNPVKVYEYLSAGKPVVTVNLPEMQFFEECVDVADNSDRFIELLAKRLQHDDDISEVEKRKRFASRQTWAERCSALIRFVEISEKKPHVSIIVVTFNNLELTKACLESLDRYTAYSNFEIVVVDNASQDGSVGFLEKWAGEQPGRVFQKNSSNLGFAAANNIGIRLARGDYFVLLNNDTYVTPGWLGGLVSHFARNDGIGLVGPVTNNIGNEAKIDIKYKSMAEMIEKSSRFTFAHLGELMPIKTLAFFCVMFSRKVFEMVGALDESFGIGFFEDDDYCRRVEKVGLSICCAQDVFVHHHLSASFKKMNGDDRRKLFGENKARYEAKWGVWQPHQQLKRK